MEEIENALGAIESPHDERDWTLASAGASEVYPDACFLNTVWMVASNQRRIGACVGCTGEEMVRQIIFSTTGKQCNIGTPDELSWRFVYALAKCLEGTSGFEQFARTPTANDGTYTALVTKILRKCGVPLAKFCPNDATLDADSFCYNRDIAQIPKDAFVDALSRKSGADLTEPVSIDGLKKAVNYAKANKGGVMILRLIGKTYSTDRGGKWTNDKVKLLPIRPDPTANSGHEETLVGYDTEPKTGRVRIYWLNHWSPEWCDNGRAWEYADEWLSNIRELRVVVPAIPVVDSFRYRFSKTLSVGASGADVVALQHVLKLEGVFPTGQAFTGHYGPITALSVKALQEKHKDEILTPSGLTHGTGNVGPVTLAWLQKHYKE